MEKNNHPNYSSRCRKIREALANSSAVRAIHRISHHHHQESSSYKPSGSPLPQPQHIKGNNSEGNGAIPIKIVHSNPTLNGHAQAGKLATKIEPEPPRHASMSAAGDGKGKSKAQDFEKQSDKKDMNYIFGEFIERARAKLRTMSNIGKAQSKPAPDEASASTVAKKVDSHRDQISDFIYHTKKKIRAPSSIRFGKNESLKRG